MSSKALILAPRSKTVEVTIQFFRVVGVMPQEVRDVAF